MYPNAICYILVNHISKAATTLVEFKFLTTKDPGVIVDNQLKFCNHINFVVTKANHTLAIIRKSFNLADKTMFFNLYKSLVRPIIEYSNVIWGPLINNQLKVCKDNLLSLCLTLNIIIDHSINMNHITSQTMTL